MVTLQYKNQANQWENLDTWSNERLAWISLGGDDANYRTVDEDGTVLTDKSI